MFENLGGAEVLVIFLVILIFFGPKKIPELATSFGKGLRKFKDAKEGLEDQFKTVMKEPLDMLQESKAQFDKHVADAQVTFQETSKSLEANYTAPAATVPEPVVPATPAPPTNMP
ncbi:MAG: twin-arginine translocase TatA/TatE family subunit [bacterium]